MHGDDGGLDYLEIIARSLGGDVDNEDGIFSDEDDDDSESDNDEDDCPSRTKNQCVKGSSFSEIQDIDGKKGR